MATDSAPPVGCVHFPDCPGCPLVGRPYAEQLAAKARRVETALAAVLPAAVDVVAPAAAALAQTGYRVQSKLMVGASPDGVRLGLYAPGSHRILDVRHCPLHDPLLQHAIPAIADVLTAARVPLHAAGRPGVRYLLLRASVAEARVLVTLVSSRMPLPDAGRLARRLRTALPLAGFLVNENTTTGNVILGARTDRIWGDDVLRERYGGVTLAAGPTAFVQANTRMAAEIYRAIADAIDPPSAGAAERRAGPRVLDLYCGVGGIALTVAARADAVVGIEEVAAAVAAAEANAARNGIAHARFHAGRVEDLVARLDARFDVVTMNPPRKGCGPAVAAAVARLASRQLLYLSCSPESFARDAAALVDGGFVLEHVQPFDLLPQTDHVELLGRFRHGHAS